MKSEIKKIDGTKREIDIEVSGDIVKNKFAEVFKTIAQTAKVPGFRPGHAPRDILEKNFSGHASEMVLKELLPQVYEEAIQKEGLSVVDLPEITDVKIDRTILKFKATVEVHPEIKLKNYKGLKIEHKKIEVLADDLKRNLDALKESRKLEKLDDGFARSLGYPNITELENAIKAQILLQKENTQRQKIENNLIEEISKDLDFKAPESLVKRQVGDLVRQAKLDLALKGMPREDIDAKENEMVTRFEAQARQQVKIYLILAEIAKKENIVVDDHMPQHVMEFLLKEADWVQAA